MRVRAAEFGERRVEGRDGAVAVGECVLRARRAADHQEDLARVEALGDEVRGLLELRRGQLHVRRADEIVADGFQRVGERVAIGRVARLRGDAEGAEVVHLRLARAAAQDVRVGGGARGGPSRLRASATLLRAEVRHADHHVARVERAERGVVLAERGSDRGVIPEPTGGVTRHEGANERKGGG